MTTDNQPDSTGEPKAPTNPEWFGNFLRKLTQAVPRKTWPKPDEFFWEVMAEAFTKIHATEDETTEAVKLYARKNGYTNRCLDDMLTLIDEVRRKSKIQTEGFAGGERELAEDSSRDCPDCRGTGYAGRVGVNPERGPGSFAFLCLCPAGRWHRSNIERAIHIAEAKRRTPPIMPPDLLNYPCLWMTQDQMDEKWPIHWPGRKAIPQAPITLDVMIRGEVVPMEFFPRGMRHTWTPPEKKPIEPPRGHAAIPPPRVMTYQPDPSGQGDAFEGDDPSTGEKP